MFYELVLLLLAKGQLTPLENDVHEILLLLPFSIPIFLDLDLDTQKLEKDIDELMKQSF